MRRPLGLVFRRAAGRRTRAGVGWAVGMQEWVAVKMTALGHIAARSPCHRIDMAATDHKNSRPVPS